MKINPLKLETKDLLYESAVDDGSLTNIGCRERIVRLAVLILYCTNLIRDWPKVIGICFHVHIVLSYFFGISSSDGL